MRHLMIGLSTSALLTQSNATPAFEPSAQWALSTLQAVHVWQFSQGQGATVAIVDTGVAPIADIKLRLLTGADFTSGLDHSTGPGTVDTSPYGHGTGMASVVGGSGVSADGPGVFGLAPQSTILPVRASINTGTELPLTLASSLNYCIASGSQIVNLSLAITTNVPSIQRAIDLAVSHGIIIVAASGNDGSSQLGYPAAYPGVLGVGAIDSTGTVWSKSNYGADVSLVAPGVNIYRDDNQGRQGYSDGTSEAAAYVSGAAALVRSAHPTWTAREVIAALDRTADKPPAMHGAEWDPHYGYGILNVLAAVQLTSPPAPPTVGPGAVVGNPGNSSTPGNGGATTTASPGDTDAAHQPPANNHDKRWGLIGGIAVGMAVAAGGGAYWVRRGRRRHQSVEPTSGGK